MNNLNEDWVKNLCLLTIGLKKPEQKILFGGYRLFFKEGENIKLDQQVINCSLAISNNSTEKYYKIGLIDTGSTSCQIVIASDFAKQLGLKPWFISGNYKGMFGEGKDCFSADKPITIGLPLATLEQPKNVKEIQFFIGPEQILIIPKQPCSDNQIIFGLEFFQQHGMNLVTNSSWNLTQKLQGFDHQKIIYCQISEEKIKVSQDWKESNFPSIIPSINNNIINYQIPQDIQQEQIIQQESKMNKLENFKDNVD